MIDTIKNVNKLNKLKYFYAREDKYSKVVGNINLPETLFSNDSLLANSPKSYPYLSDVMFNIKDTLLIVP